MIMATKTNQQDDLVYNPKIHSFSPDMLQEFLFNLASINKELTQNQNRSKFSGVFKCKTVSVFMLNLCDDIGINTESKFLALELFDRFMCVHLKEIEEAMNKTPNRNWTPTINKIKDQIILRSLSCIQLAHKLCSNNLVLRCTQIKQILLELGYNFSIESITSSELRVFKYLDYRLNAPTPCQFIEILLEILNVNNDKMLNNDTNILHLISMKMLECFYCEREEIYDRLYESITSRSRDSLEDRISFLPIENDYLYLSSSIIVASAYIYDNKGKKIFNLVLDSIAFISNQDKSELEEFASILCHFSLLN